MQIGRRLYFDSVGNLLVNTGERTGAVIVTTVEQDFQSYASLIGTVPATVTVKELQYGELAQDFAECNGVRLNTTTGLLEFSYPDPNAPEAPPVYQVPLTEQVAELKAKDAEIIFTLVMNDLM